MNDLISRAKVIEIINEFDLENRFDSWNDYSEMHDIISELPAANEWISCKERLPEDNRPVLCYVTSTTGEGSMFIIGSCEKGNFWFLKVHGGMQFSFPNIQLKVTHWQPLPEPPEVKR